MNYAASNPGIGSARDLSFSRFRHPPHAPDRDEDVKQAADRQFARAAPMFDKFDGDFDDSQAARVGASEDFVDDARAGGAAAGVLFGIWRREVRKLMFSRWESPWTTAAARSCPMTAHCGPRCSALQRARADRGRSTSSAPHRIPT